MRGTTFSSRTAACSPALPPPSPKTKPLPVIDLSKTYREHGFGDRAATEFAVPLVSTKGRRKWVVLDRLAMSPDTKWFPVWRKVANSDLSLRIRFSRSDKAPIELLQQLAELAPRP